MSKDAILNGFRDNAQHMCSPTEDRRPWLLSIDLDDYYTNLWDMSQITQEVSGFLQKVRHNFRIIHIWHDLEIRCRHDLAPGFRSTDLVPIDKDEEIHKKLFPATNPQPGEWALAKRDYSAFRYNDLAKTLDKNVPIFVMGGIGRSFSKPSLFQCIDSTIRHGLHENFQMVAIPDLIFPRYVNDEYDGKGPAVEINSQDILLACGHD